MYLDKEGGGDRICRHKDIGGDCATEGNICKQTLDDLCPYQCTEWSGIFEGYHTPGVNETNHGMHSPNVCQSTVPGEEHKCRGKKQAGVPLECDESIKKTEIRCRQRPVLDCWLFCEGWKESSDGASADQNSELVCQNLDAGHKEFGMCYPQSSYNCDANAQKSHNLLIAAGVGSGGSGPAVCKQVVHKCVNPCAAGSTWTAPTGTTLETISVCQDSKLLCSKGECDSTRPRCRPTDVHQNTGNIDTPGQDWPVAPHQNQDALKFAAHHAAAVKKVALEQQGKAVMRRDSAEEVKGQ